MKHRYLEATIQELLKQYPVLTLTGPRQSGKTTLLREFFSDWEYFSLENPDMRRRLLADPNDFFNSLTGGVVLDEVQRTPELLSYIQTHVDLQQVPGQFLLTGSAQFNLLESITQSLAGRTAILKLLPFSMDEAYSRDDLPDLDHLLYTGFFPRIFDKQLNPTQALSFYCDTYIQRDVRSLINVRDLGRFETFLRLLSGVTGRILNLSSIGNACGASHNTITGWISALEASFLVYRLRPHFINFRKRQIRAPKLHWLDVGLAAFLLGIEEEGHLSRHPLRGELFESFVTAELIKQRYNQGKPLNLYYWRDSVGHEVDLIFDFGDLQFPVEIKSSRTVTRDFFRNLDYYRKLNGNCREAALVYGGDETWREKDTWVVSYRDLGVFRRLDREGRLKVADNEK